jgi:hypothetical protein
MFYKQIAELGGRLRIISVSYPALSDPARLADGLSGLMDYLGLARASIPGDPASAGRHQPGRVRGLRRLLAGEQLPVGGARDDRVR